MDVEDRNREMLAAFVHHSPCHFLRKNFSVDLYLFYFAMMTGQGALGRECVLLFAPFQCFPGLQTHVYTPDF